jgi:hypothetical protein
LGAVFLASTLVVLCAAAIAIRLLYASRMPRTDDALLMRSRSWASTISPTMAANVTKRLWEIGDIVDVLEAWENTT